MPQSPKVPPQSDRPDDEEEDEKPLILTTERSDAPVQDGRDGSLITRGLICGIDVDLVERFLVLIRDHYKKVDKATFFLEHRTGEVNLPSMANMRDVLSHLVTLLSSETPDDRREEQLATAEEHLRRAILEPYEVALSERTVKFEELYDKYRTRLLPVQEKYSVLRAAPNAGMIQASLREINALADEGRANKARNLWTTEWERGVSSYISAFEQLDALYMVLDKHWNDYEQIHRDKRHVRLNVLSIAIGAIGGLIGILGIIFGVLLWYLSHPSH